MPLTQYPGGPVDKPVYATAERLGVAPEQVLLPWIKSKGAVILTTISKKEQLERYQAVANIDLTDEDIAHWSKFVGPTGVASLKVHPDKNPSPEAATLFHALTQAYNFLPDPTQRSALDASLAARRARAAQLAASSEKKCTMLEELECAERAAKRFKVDSLAEERKKREEEERI
ncbi:hypothetical protein DACRYDRAFT_15595 [Dacryopinax primogenitus]|uniref:J domain-containing protein n=1 Tax=Dacryopinax primogenitus (strain DJM 731) TaxID=1858805 RepID=M5G8T2_DACPD|nr:uncharacterized protein DACRYDRAFT_15595 [Dacryopinax primogenitus]EJU02262.1 hypothetical protein DACRYDRAFT_15595 [Dacryopinax primogenitus]